GWKGATVPPRMSYKQVQALLDSCDRTTVRGLRDFAMLILLARLGLRAAEVAGLRLEDLRWRDGEVVVRGKSRRTDRLPLPADVGDAVVQYLRKGRPVTEARTVFVTLVAPRRPLHPAAVSQTVQRQCRRAGLPPVRAHALRHALATNLLERGVYLPQISQLLRHADLATTSVYAKVDYPALRELAPAWTGSRP
ncbi:MAG: tyrosine-type recombinase/integrase, partial [Actinomycetota bacterium]|nr:tyrosine-type recombinase/integrase [Actinomycetota bacterium]